MSAFSLTAVRMCLAFCLLSAFCGGVAAQNRYVYLVKATSSRALTGFRIQGKKGIITALHGVADGTTITVMSVDGTPRDSRVTIYEVDVAHDLARLSSPEFERLPAEGFAPAPPVDWKSLSRVRVIGYPLGLTQQDLTIPLTVGEPPLKTLGYLVDAETGKALKTRASPKPTLPVLYLVGPLHPGHSGAPILDGKNRVVAVGNGGLKVFSNIGWAIPWRGLSWKPARANPDLARLKRSASVGLFSFDPNPQAAQERIEKLLTGIRADTQGIKRDTARIVALLEEELQVKNGQIAFLQGQLAQASAPVPSARARELAAQIPSDADAYALALKAIAERRFDDARKLLRQAEAEKEVELARLYQAHGDTEFYAGGFSEAVFWYRKALSLKPDTLDIMNMLGLALLKAANYAEAEPLFKRGLTIIEKALGPEHPDMAASLDALGLLYAVQDKYAEAEPLLKRGLTIIEKALGPEHPDMAASLYILALVYQNQGRYAEAEPLLKQALTITEKALGPEHPDTAASLNVLALLYYAYQHKYAEAEPLLKRGLSITEKAFGPEHPDTATSLNNLAMLYDLQGSYAEAEPLYKRVLTITEKALGPEHPDTATSLNNLAALYRTQGKYVEAEPLLKRALTITEKVLGPEHPDTATSINNLALLYHDQSKYAEAEPLYKRALTIREKVLGPEHLDTATSLNNLAMLYDLQGSYAEAEPLLKRALTITEKALGPEHPSTATSINNLAALYHDQSKYAEAEPLLKRALNIMEKALGPEHPNTLTALENYAYLLRKMNRNTEAEALEVRAAAISKAHPQLAPSP